MCHHHTYHLLLASCSLPLLLPLIPIHHLPFPFHSSGERLTSSAVPRRWTELVLPFHCDPIIDASSIYREVDEW